jgi:integrase
MVGAGMEIFALSRRLGHESITVTMDRYSHLLPDAQFTGAQVAAKALEGI